MEKDKFWETVQKDKDTVKLWPQWMQDIVITAQTCSTGKFIKTRRKKNESIKH